MMRPSRVAVLGAGLLAIAGCASRVAKVEPSDQPVRASGVTAGLPMEAVPQHVMLAPDKLDWQPFPAGAPGSKMAVLAGDPTKPGPFVVRLKQPKGSRIPPHWHPTDEHVTVIEGTLALGMGDTYDAKALRTLRTKRASLPPKKHGNIPL